MRCIWHDNNVLGTRPSACQFGRHNRIAPANIMRLWYIWQRIHIHRLRQRIIPKIRRPGGVIQHTTNCHPPQNRHFWVCVYNQPRHHCPARISNQHNRVRCGGGLYGGRHRINYCGRKTPIGPIVTIACVGHYILARPRNVCHIGVRITRHHITHQFPARRRICGGPSPGIKCVSVTLDINIYGRVRGMVGYFLPCGNFIFARPNWRVFKIDRRNPPRACAPRQYNQYKYI